jgi:hypothetical protein
MFLGQYVSAPMQETIAYLKLSYEGLAHEMSVPEMVLRDPVDGKMTRGQWVRFGRVLGLATTYSRVWASDAAISCPQPTRVVGVSRWAVAGESIGRRRIAGRDPVGLKPSPRSLTTLISNSRPQGLTAAKRRRV